MKLQHASLLILYAALLALAQILLKGAVSNAQRYTLDGHLLSFLTALLKTWTFWATISLYGFMTFVWAWLLTFIPLSAAYPFVALTIAFIGIFEFFCYGVPLSPAFFIGALLIGSGLYCITAMGK